MGNLLFSPSGRINSGDFMKGATLIIVITLVLGLLPIISAGLAALSVVTIVFLWCWVVLWVKRYHDAGKSGWTCLLPIIVYLVLAAIVGIVLPGMFTDPEAAAAAAEAAAEAAEAGDFGAIFKAAAGGGMTTMGKIIVPLASAAVSFGVAFLFNNMINGDAGDNQFGPQT